VTAPSLLATVVRAAQLANRHCPIRLVPLIRQSHIGLHFSPCRSCCDRTRKHKRLTNFESGRGFEGLDQTYAQGFYSVVRRRSCAFNPRDMSTGALILAAFSAWFKRARRCHLSWRNAVSKTQPHCRLFLFKTAPNHSAGTSVWRTSAALNCVTGRAVVPCPPSSTNRTFVGRAVSSLHRPAVRAVIPSPSVTVAVVRWWVSIAVVRRPRVIILRLGRHECARRDRANEANSQEYPRCTHCAALLF
jgi:hypothetical protein